MIFHAGQSGGGFCGQNRLLLMILPLRVVTKKLSDLFHKLPRTMYTSISEIFWHRLAANLIYIVNIRQEFFIKFESPVIC